MASQEGRCLVHCIRLEVDGSRAVVHTISRNWQWPIWNKVNYPEVTQFKPLVNPGSYEIWLRGSGLTSMCSQAGVRNQYTT